MSRRIYIIGSMKNTRIPFIAKTLRDIGYDAFDDWWSPGPDADDFWQSHEKTRGRTYREALEGWHARHVFAFDKTHLDACEAALLVLPAGKSAHMEFGYTIGSTKPGYVLFEKEPERYDIMYQFATQIFMSLEEMVVYLGGVI